MAGSTTKGVNAILTGHVCREPCHTILRVLVLLTVGTQMQLAWL